MKHRWSSLLLCAAYALVGGAPLTAQGDALEIKRLEDGVPLLVYSSRGVRPAPPAVASLEPDEATDRLVDHYSRRHGLDPKLVRSVIQIESAFDPRARSRRGAMGLMQLMPETAIELGVENVWDPAENIRGGTAYLRQMLDRFGEIELALAGYNAGPTVVEKYGAIPPYPETRRYVTKVLGLYRGGGIGIRRSGRIARPVLARRDPERGLVLYTPE